MRGDPEVMGPDAGADHRLGRRGLAASPEDVRAWIARQPPTQRITAEALAQHFHLGDEDEPGWLAQFLRECRERGPYTRNHALARFAAIAAQYEHLG
jgi:hypothetical protein